MKKGKLKTWKDDRGFGFIQPEAGDRDVFLHISAVKRASRRPQVGDIILYEPVTEADGKIRAAKASIQGATVSPQSKTYRQKQRKAPKRQKLSEIAGLAVFVTGFFVFQYFRSNPSSLPIFSGREPGCNIKGNISINTDKKWYHLPGMEDYNSTRIDPTKGEKWFCTESEAISEGWQKAPR